MSEPFKTLAKLVAEIESLKRREIKEHEALVARLDELSIGLRAAITAAAVEISKAIPAQEDSERTVPERVFEVLSTSKFLTLSQIAAATTLTVPQVKSALYVGRLKKFVEKREAGQGRVEFRRRKGVDPWRSERTLSERIRAILANHSKGLTTRQLSEKIRGATSMEVASALSTMVQSGSVTSNRVRPFIYVLTHRSR
jgi:hypothetical protein